MIPGADAIEENSGATSDWVDNVTAITAATEILPTSPTTTSEASGSTPTEFGSGWLTSNVTGPTASGSDDQPTNQTTESGPFEYTSTSGNDATKLLCRG